MNLYYPMYQERCLLVMDLGKLTASVVTMSDSRASGMKKADESGKIIIELLKSNNYQIVEYRVISDDFDEIKRTLIEICDIEMYNKKINLVLTTGGTGLSPRDNTPEATKAVIDKEVQGISEAMRYHSLQITPRAMLSRGVSGIRSQSLIVNLPGSPKAVKENLEYVLPHLKHGIEILNGTVQNCAEETS